jgi:hypothetical protein
MLAARGQCSRRRRQEAGGEQWTHSSISFSSRFCAQNAAFGLSAPAFFFSASSRAGGFFKAGVGVEPPAFASRVRPSRGGVAAAGWSLAGADARSGGVAAAGSLGGVLLRSPPPDLFRVDGGSFGGE